jgi:hypothetical protein
MRLRGFVQTTSFLALAGLFGCDSAPTDFPRQTINGEVTLDGRPLEEGLISFEPEGRPEPVAAGVVIDGRFEVPRSDGPAPGRHKVAVWARKQTGESVRDASDPTKTVAEAVSIIPERFNARTELTVEVASGRSNTFRFDLDSRVPRTSRRANKHPVSR